MGQCHLCLLVLFVVSATALIDCSRKYSCFAESAECDPDVDCQTVLHIDIHGNVDIILRKVSPTDYAAIVNDHDLFNSNEYFVCVPFINQRLRAIGRTGEVVLFTQQNQTNVVEKLGEDTFRCIINVEELSKNFRNNNDFTISRGKFFQFLNISKGIHLQRLELDQARTVDEDLAADFILPANNIIDGSVVQKKSLTPITSVSNQSADSIIDHMLNNCNHSKLERLSLKKTPISEVHASIKSLNERNILKSYNSNIELLPHQRSNRPSSFQNENKIRKNREHRKIIKNRNILSDKRYYSFNRKEGNLSKNGNHLRNHKRRYDDDEQTDSENIRKLKRKHIHRKFHIDDMTVNNVFNNVYGRLRKSSHTIRGLLIKELQRLYKKQLKSDSLQQKSQTSKLRKNNFDNLSKPVFFSLFNVALIYAFQL